MEGITQSQQLIENQCRTREDTRPHYSRAATPTVHLDASESNHPRADKLRVNWKKPARKTIGEAVDLDAAHRVTHTAH